MSVLPKKTECLRFRIGVKLYQWFGYFTDFVRDAQDQYLDDNMDRFLDQYLEHKKADDDDGGFDLSFSNYLSIETGRFQCRHRLYRSPLLFSRGLFGKIYRLYYYNVEFRVKVLLRRYKI